MSDPNLERHHRFADEETGRVYDVPWKALRVNGAGSLGVFEVREFQAVMKGRTKKTKRKKTKRKTG